MNSLLQTDKQASSDSENALRFAFESYLEARLPALNVKPQTFNSVLQHSKAKLLADGQDVTELLLSFSFALTYLLRSRPLVTTETYILNLAADTQRPQLNHLCALLRDICASADENEVSIVELTGPASKVLSSYSSQLI